jgi:hypothetical protein
MTAQFEHFSIFVQCGLSFSYNASHVFEVFDLGLDALSVQVCLGVASEHPVVALYDFVDELVEVVEVEHEVVMHFDNWLQELLDFCPHQLCSLRRHLVIGKLVQIGLCMHDP